LAIAWNVPAHGSAASAAGVARARPPAPGHLLRRPPRERQQQDPARVGAARDQRSDPVRERLRLPGPRPRDDQKRAIIGVSGAPLRQIELHVSSLYECSGAAKFVSTARSGTP
jgi:hypothetical protein